MTDTALENQTCPFCRAELDAHAIVCGNCGATKDLTPAWMAKGKGIFLSLMIGVIGISFLSGGFGGAGGWFDLILLIIAAGFLFWISRMDFSKPIWRRKQ